MTNNHSNRSLIIAEAGVNHNGSKELAFKLVDIAIAAKADIVKFQTFKADNLVTKTASQSAYQIKSTGKEESQYEMLKRLELSYDSHIELRDYCANNGIKFLSTAFDLPSLKFLVEQLKVDLLKIPSGEVTNTPLVLAHAKTQCDIILSTGMCNLADIELALGVIAFGYINPDREPSTQAFAQAYQSDLGQRLLKQKVTILHCTTEYPAPFNEINLNVMSTLSHSFKLNVGYSDHSEGILVPLAAVAKGAFVIEKHFTIDKNMPGPDHKASLSPSELTQMVAGIRLIEQTLGNGIKAPSPSEISNKHVARKSLVANREIKQGELLTDENLAIKRPGTGIEPQFYWDYLGKKVTSNYNEGDLINE